MDVLESFLYTVSSTVGRYIGEPRFQYYNHNSFGLTVRLND